MVKCIRARKKIFHPVKILFMQDISKTDVQNYAIVKSSHEVLDRCIMSPIA